MVKKIKLTSASVFNISNHRMNFIYQLINSTKLMSQFSQVLNAIRKLFSFQTSGKVIVFLGPILEKKLQSMIALSALDFLKGMI